MIRFSSVRKLLGFVVFAPLSAAPHPAPAAAWTNVPPHPRLFATAEQWQALRTRLAAAPAADPVSTRLFALIRARAEAVLNLPPVKITTRSRGNLAGTILEPAREIQRRVLLLAATARLTGDSRFRAGRVRQRQTIWSAR